MPSIEDHGAFDAWPLHDAVLSSVRMDWGEKRCVIALAVFLVEGQDAFACEITFDGVTEVMVPCKAPWGSSSHVNGQQRLNGAFVLEMQSGDEVCVTAEGARLSKK